MKLTNLLKENKSVNEARVSAKKLLQSVVKGETDRVEGIKLSKEMAQSFLDWQRLSPYGKKYGDLPFNRLFTAAFSWGLHRYADKKSKEYKELEAKANQMFKARRGESVNEVLTPFKTSVKDGNMKELITKYKEYQKSGDIHKRREVYKELIKLGNKFNFKRDDWKTTGRVSGAGEKAFAPKYIKFYSESLNEAKYDIGMARKGNGITVYNKAEEEGGDYKNVAHIDNKGKIKYYDKKIPSNIKKEIEQKAAEMMEMATESGMKLTDLIKESNVQIGKVYSNPYAKSWVKEEEEQRPQAEEMTEEHRAAFFEAVKGYKTYGESVYRKEGLTKVYESIKGMVEMANKVTLAETGDWFDGVTVSRHMKRMNESFKVFEKTLKEVSTLQQRLESSYDEIGEVLGKYYEINELEEGNEFGAKNEAKNYPSFADPLEGFPQKYKELLKKLQRSNDKNERKKLIDKMNVIRKNIKLKPLTNETEEMEEGNEFGAARAKAIANGDNSFEVDGKKYPVKDVDKDDKENAKKFANESINEADFMGLPLETFADYYAAADVALSIGIGATVAFAVLAKLGIQKGTRLFKKGKKAVEAWYNANAKKESVSENTSMKLTSLLEGASTEEKRIVMMAVRKIAKYRNVDIKIAAGDVMRAAMELERDIEKGKVKK